MNLFIATNNLNISAVELIDIIDIDCYDITYDEGIPIGVELDSGCAIESMALNLQNELGLSDGEANWLLENESVLFEVQSYLENNNLEFESSATEAARIYINLKVTDEEFSIFDEEFEDAPIWWLPFVKDIAKEALLEILKRRVNGSLAGLPQDLIEAVDAISNGDILGVLGESLDIAKRFFPVLQGIDTFFDGVELLGKGTKAWRAISKLKTFGDDVIQNILSIVRQRAGGLLGKIKWINQSTGIKVDDILNPSTFFDDLVDLFPNVISTNVDGQGNTVVKLEGGVDLIYQPTSGTTGSPSIRIKKGGYTIKIRF